MDDGTLERMADLVVEFGANVQPGQRVHVGASIGQESLARAIAGRCYRAGAVFVHVAYADPWVQRARLDEAVDEALGYEPGWIVQMIREHGEERGRPSASPARSRRACSTAPIPTASAATSRRAARSRSQT